MKGAAPGITRGPHPSWTGLDQPMRFALTATFCV